MLQPSNKLGMLRMDKYHLIEVSEDLTMIDESIW